MLTSKPFSEGDTQSGSRISAGSSSGDVSGFGLAWDARRGRWISLVYRYVFPRSSFWAPAAGGLSGSAGTSSTSTAKGRGRFEFGPCKQHHLTIGQSPFERRSRMGSRRHVPPALRRNLQFTNNTSGAPSKLAHISEENLMSFMDPVEYGEEPPSMLLTTEYTEYNESPKRYNHEDMETMLLDEFLSSAIVYDVDHHHHQQAQYQQSGYHHHPQQQHQQQSPRTDNWYINQGILESSGMPAPSSPPPPLFLDGSCPIPDLAFD